MAHSIILKLSRSSPTYLASHPFSILNPTMATAQFSFKLARKTLKSPPDPGRYSTYASVTRPVLAGGIPHPSTYGVKPSEEPKTFTQPSKPRPRYQRPQFKTRELPEIKVIFASAHFIMHNSHAVALLTFGRLDGHYSSLWERA